MQSNIINRVALAPVSILVKPTITGHVYQVRNHVKMYPWRRLRSVRYSYLDNNRTPYTDKHNPNEFSYLKTSLKPWMRVTCKDKEAKFNKYAWNESYTSDPKEARETATSRLGRFQQSLRDRGDARERKPYTPPDNVDSRVRSIYVDIVSEKDEKLANANVEELSDASDMTTIDLNKFKQLKFSLITKCIQSFDHDMPGSYLNDMNTIEDVIQYFSAEVRGVSPFDALVNKDELPPNLSILQEPDRFNKEADTKFKGISAMPGIVSQVPGLRAKKKYAVLNQDEFQWPDI